MVDLWRSLEGQPDWVLLAGVPYLIFAGLYFTVGFSFLLLDFWPALHARVRSAKCQPSEAPTWDGVVKILKVTVP